MTKTAITPYEPYPGDILSIDELVRVAEIPRRKILLYCRYGFVRPVTDPEREGYFFDAAVLRTLRQIEYLHSGCAISLRGVQMIVELRREVERLRSELEFHRE